MHGAAVPETSEARLVKRNLTLNPVAVQMPAESGNVDSARVCADRDHQALAHQLLQSNDVTKLKDALAVMNDAQISEVDSCGVPRKSCVDQSS